MREATPEEQALIDASFMKPFAYKGSAFLVDTMHGTEVVPDDLVSTPPGCLGDEELGDEHDDCESCSAWINELQQFCDGGIINTEGLVAVGGWLARLSAPGYMDCTPWELHETHDEAITSLMNQLAGE